MFNGLKKLLAALFVGCCVVLESSAAIVSMNPATGKITWDISSLKAGLIQVLGYAIASVLIIILIRSMWRVIQEYLGFPSISETLENRRIQKRLKDFKTHEAVFDKAFTVAKNSGLSPKKAYQFAQSNRRSYKNHGFVNMRTRRGGTYKRNWEF